MSKDERKLKSKVDEYFEKYWSVSFKKFIENWEETSEALKYKDKEIEKLKELVIALWHNDNARLLNKEQIDLLNNIVFGNDEEDLGSDKE